MSRLSLRLLRVYDCCRLLLDKTICQDGYTDQDERKTEPLSHIQGHILLKHHLRLLDELYKETHAEKNDEEDADEHAAIHLLQSELVEQDEYDSENQITEGFIKLCRVFRKGFTVTLEDESPRQIGNVSVDFGIEKVTKSDEYCSKADRDAKPVKNPKEIKVILPSIMP